MSRIGIVSRIHGINYGANLQAFALQEFLEQLGNEVEYINYEVKISNKGLRRIFSLGYKCIRYLFGYRKRLKRTRLFRERIHFSEEVYTQESLTELDKEYDITLCGSDQIWNPRYYSKSNGLYLLKFSKKKKASYASSFGVEELPKDYSEIVSRELSTFYSLSTREQTGVLILNNLGMRCQRHIDPTFLLTPEKWEEYSDRRPLVSGAYICCYVMPGVKALNKFIINTAEKLLNERPGLKKIVVIGEREYEKIFSSHIYITTAGPLDFINIISNANIVLTSSFHGTCFSIIFNKPFYSILDRTNKFNSRILDLLSTLDLEQRIRWFNESAKFTDFDTIEYQTVNNKIDLERKRALLYLKSITE